MKMKEKGGQGKERILERSKAASDIESNGRD